MADFIAVIDSQLEQLFTSWNLWTTVLVLFLFALTVYPLLTNQEPDTHPLLLSRQANISAVRQPNESAIYRSLEIPHGLPLRSGLNVKDAGTSKWSAGRDGDLRDIWRRVVSGPLGEDGRPTGSTSSIFTVRGKVVEQHDMGHLSTQITAVGNYVKQKRSTCVAIYLPNSLELLIAVFAGAFYGFHPVLLPYGQPQDVILRLIEMSSADYLIANAGTLSFANVKTQCPNLRELMWVVQKTSRHMDWNETSESLSTTTWHEVIELQNNSPPQELPKDTEEQNVPDLITIWLNETATSGEIVAFTQKNLSAAVAAQSSTLPSRHRITPKDLFLATDNLTSPYILVQTLNALWAGASLALNSVAGEDVDLKLACAHIQPTLIATSAVSAKKLHEVIGTSVDSPAKRLALRSQTQALQSGHMPTHSLFHNLSAPAQVILGEHPSRLRLLYVFERAHSGTPALTPTALSELRAFTESRVIYALTAAKVAGTIAQTAFYDYRIGGRSARGHNHFGPPVSSLEVKLTDTDGHKTLDGQDPTGEIVVLGPAVANGRANLGILGRFRTDGTLAYV